MSTTQTDLNANATGRNIATDPSMMSPAATAILEQSTSADQIITLHPDEIYVDPNTNGRHPSSDNKRSVKELAADIKINGQMQPVIVRPWTMPDTKPDGTEWSQEETDAMAGKTCQLVFGYQRYAAICMLMEEGVTVTDGIKAVIRDWDETQSLNANVSENLRRKDLNMLDRSHVATMLLEKKYTGREAAKAMGISPGMVTKLKSFDKLIPELQSLVASGNLTVDGAYELSSKDEATQKKAADAINAELETIEGISGADGEVGNGAGGGKKRKKKKASAPAGDEVPGKKPPTLKQVRDTFGFIAGGCKDKDEEGNVVEPATAPNSAAISIAKDLVRYTQGKISAKVMTTRLMTATA